MQKRKLNRPIFLLDQRSLLLLIKRQLTHLKFILFFAFFPLFSIGQNSIDVTENSFKVSALGEEVLYFGFAQGDKVIFSFTEQKGKKLKEVEITELPGSSKFQGFKIQKIKDKELIINRTGIYKFRFSNSSVSGRICNVHIRRIPASEETQNFNTSVYWKTLVDTTFREEQERYILRIDTAVHNITDQLAKVHSSGNLNGNKTIFNFSLPKNTISWSYYVGVNQEGQKEFEKATGTIALKSASFLLKMPGYGPLAALALGSSSYITHLQKGEDIDYYIVQGENAQLFLNDNEFYLIKQGKVINDFSRMTDIYNGHLYFCLRNDNAITGVTVMVKITAITATKIWDTRTVTKYRVDSRQVPYLQE